ncbi:MAG: methylamine utilization protein [Burkholderiales bacterium]|nr:methylamine utilization protein [Burkholderiales bacterium]
MRKTIFWFGSMILLSALTSLAHANAVVQVQDSKGHGLQDVVVYAEPASGKSAAKSATAEIEQKNKTFIPLVTVVQTGTSISFPNNDTVRHHAYSFSPAKPFELKLYSGKPAAPIVFDKAGTVIVGCNIHDQMVAYIRVVDTPFFAKTDHDGNAHLPAMPNGQYVLKTWYYKQLTGNEVQQQDWQFTNDSAPLVVKLSAEIKN